MNRLRSISATVGVALLAVSLLAAAPQKVPPPSVPEVDPKIVTLAREWLHRFQVGNIDRSQLNDAVALELTDAMVAQEETVLRPLGQPVTFKFIRSQPMGAVAIGYDFIVTFKSEKKIIESLALDDRGKIAGIDFRVYVPTPSS